MTFKRILIAVDESAFAAHAAEVGIELSKALNAELAFMHVLDPTVTGAAPEAGVDADTMVSMARQRARGFLSAFQERAGAKPAALEFLEVGKPATRIVEGARAWPADLIVIGSHGPGVLGRLLLGSVAESVVRHASCPVLVVRSPK